MYLPTPNENESQNDFNARCIDVMMNEPNNKYPREQIVAICESKWRESKKACPSCTGVLNCEATDKTKLPTLSDIIKRLENVKDFLIGKFGEVGRTFYEATLVRLGVYDPKTAKYNCNLLKSDLALPFVKSESENSFEIGNLVLAENEFVKIDDVEKTVEAYANTIVCDCEADIVLPESYRASAEAYSKPIFFMHHVDMPAGEFLSGKVDEIGWYVKSKPKPAFWTMIKDGTLKGYSIGGWFAGVGKQIGETIIWSYDVRIGDLSYVSKPCNKLSFFNLINSKLPEVTATHGETVGILKKEEKKMTEKIETATPNPQATTDTQADKKLSDMNSAELITYIRRQEAEKIKADFLKLAEETDDELKVRQDDARIVAINKAIGAFTAKLDGMIKTLSEFGTKIADVEAKVAGVATRLVKMEETPSMKPTGQPSTDDELGKTIEHATNFDQVAEYVESKSAKGSTQ